MSSKLIQAIKGLTREGISKLSDAATRFDDWQNQVTGFGTTADKTTYTSFVGSLRLPDQQLSNLYHGDDLAARMIDIVPDELLREGFTVDTGDVGLNAELSEQLDALSLDGKLADGWRWGRLYGGAALVLGADDGRSASTPLIPERAKSLAFAHVIDRRYLWPLTYYREPTHPKLGQPETYMVSASSAHTDESHAIVHESRLVLFGGATTGILEREQNNSWDHSVLQRALQPLAAFNTGWKSVELLLTDANQAVFKMSGLAEVLGAGGEEVMKKRMQMIDLCRSVMRAMVVDAGGEDGTAKEEFTRQSVSFADIPQTLDKFMLRLAAAVQIPVTILMGQSPAGMSATGDSDFRWFYDRIRSEQTRKLSPKIRRIIKVMLATKAFSAKAERVDVKFPALWTETPSVQATTRKTLLEGDAIATTNGFLVASEVATKRFGEPNGFDSEIQLTDEGKAARDAELKGDLEDLSKPPDEREPPPDDGGGFGGGGFGRSDADDQPRDDDGRFASGDGGGSGGAGKGGSGSPAAPKLEHLEAHHEEVSRQLERAEIALDKATERVDNSTERLDEAKSELDDAREEHESLQAEAHAEEQARAAATKDLADSEREHHESETKARALGEAKVSELKQAETEARTAAKDRNGTDESRAAALEKANDLRDERRSIEKELKKPDKIGPILAQAREAAEKGDFKTVAKLESKFDRATPLKANLANNTTVEGLPDEASFGGASLLQVDHTSTAIRDAAAAKAAAAKAERRVAIREKALKHNERKLAEATKQHAELTQKEAAASDAISNYEEPEEE